MADFLHAFKVILFLLLALIYPVICYGCDKRIKTQKNSCYTCKKKLHLKCLFDFVIEDEERLFCFDCKPPEPEFIVNALDPDLRAFLQKRGFKILHQNINGFVRKLDKVKTFLSDSKNSVNILCLSETHTNSTIKKAELEIPNYVLERKDRWKGKHGGVSMYLRDDVSYRRREDLEIEGLEILWVEIFVPKSKSLLVCSTYRPPDTSKYIDKNFVEKFNSMLDAISAENRETIMCGDYNINYKVSNDHIDLKNLVKMHGFSQIIKSFTRITKRSRTLIDLFYTTDESKIVESLVYENSVSDHSLIGVNRKSNCKRFIPKTIKTRDYSKYNSTQLKDELRQVPWENCLQADFNTGWNLFKHYITSSIDRHAPIKVKKMRGNSNPWLTHEIRQLMNTRDYHKRKFKQTDSEIHWESYQRLRNKVNNKLRTAKANHVRKTMRESADNANAFWKQIKNCYPTKDSCSPAKSFKVDGKYTSDKSLIANAFCKFFTNVGSSLLTSPIVDYTWKVFNIGHYMRKINPRSHVFKFREVTLQETLKILKSTKSSKATGIDTIPAKVIKEIAEEIAPPLTFLINKSLEHGIFPSAEKIAKITPLYKSGDRSNTDNYRPISILNIISKVVERVVFDQLSNYLEENNLLSDYQYGFRKKRSTKDAVTKFTDHIRKNMDSSKVTGALYMDLRKAFDTVNHSCLLHKLPYYGILNIEVEWFSSYLFQRSQTVFLDGILSSKEFVTHGVPQGSILGPLLFVLLINDLPNQLQFCNVLMYADDTVLYFSSKCSKEIENCINSDANSVNSWMKENCMILNPKKGKTEFVMYACRTRKDPIKVVVDNNVINQPNMYTYLGVILDSHLNMHAHFQAMYNRISSRTKLLNRIRHKISPIVAATIFRSMIQPLFFYCYPAFGQMSNTWINKFESVTNRARRIIRYHRSLPSFKLSLKRMMAVDAFKIMHGIKSNDDASVIKHKYKTKGNNNTFRLPRVLLMVGRKLSYYQSALVFNELKDDMRKEDSYVRFKNKMKNYVF